MRIRPIASNLNPELSLRDTGSMSVVFVPLPTDRLQQAQESENTQDWDRKDRPLGRGLAICLELLRIRKELNQQKSYGRMKDGDSGNEIMHYNNQGRVLTKKQAFRQQCYSFHNQVPAQSKIQRLKDKDDAEVKAQKSLAASDSFKMTKAIMQKTQNPYIVLSKL